MILTLVSIFFYYETLNSFISTCKLATYGSLKTYVVLNALNKFMSVPININEEICHITLISIDQLYIIVPVV